jgi:hypothetical protein
LAKIGGIRARLFGPKKLSFIVAGAQKCGTTAFHSLLKQHPQILLPDRQELHFFDKDELFSGQVDYRKLHQHFKPTRTATIAGENTPIYIYWPPVMERIHAYNPTIKILAILRNPIERAFSQWNMQRERGLDKREFLTAVSAEQEAIRKGLAIHPESAYISRGFYTEQLKRLFSFFPAEQVLLIKFEDLRADPHKTMEGVFKFLRVDPFIEAHSRERNKIPYAREITESERREVGDLFSDEIARVEAMLGWDCSEWKKV